MKTHLSAVQTFKQKKRDFHKHLWAHRDCIRADTKAFCNGQFSYTVNSQPKNNNVPQDAHYGDNTACLKVLVDEHFYFGIKSFYCCPGTCSCCERLRGALRSEQAVSSNAQTALALPLLFSAKEGQGRRRSPVLTPTTKTYMHIQPRPVNSLPATQAALFSWC